MTPSDEIFFFDLDGPILDVSERHYRLYTDTVAALGGRALEAERYWPLKRRGFRSEILERSKLADRTEEFTAYWQDRIESSEYLALDRVWPGTCEILEHLSQRIRLVLVTLRRRRAELDEQLRSLTLTPHFSAVLSRGNHPGAGFEVKVDRVQAVFAGSTPRGWFIGDSTHDLRAGRKLGLSCAAVGFGLRASDLLEAECPDEILQTPAELHGWLERITRA